ncbi:MAG: hypothetical protein PWP23_366 [Candidatus Sumerlaeota bacterium]|nr:hypothetical protein [Candidatus Sumerlaeota bacterium]
MKAAHPAIHLVPLDEDARHLAEEIAALPSDGGLPAVLVGEEAPDAAPTLHFGATGRVEAVRSALREVLADTEQVAALKAGVAYRLEAEALVPPPGIPGELPVLLLAERLLRSAPLGEPTGDTTRLADQLRSCLGGFGEDLIRALVECPEAVIHDPPPVFDATNPYDVNSWQTTYDDAVAGQMKKVDDHARQTLSVWSESLERIGGTVLPTPWASLSWAHFVFHRLHDSQTFFSRRLQFAEEIRHPSLTDLRAACLLPFYNEAVLLSWFDFLLASIEGLLMKTPPNIPPITSFEDYSLHARRLGKRLENERRRRPTPQPVGLFGRIVESLVEIGRKTARFPPSKEFAALAAHCDEAWQALLVLDEEERKAVAARQAEVEAERAQLVASQNKRGSGVFFWRRGNTTEEKELQERLDSLALRERAHTEDHREFATEIHTAAEILRIAGPCLHAWARVVETWEAIEERRAASLERIDTAARTLRALADRFAGEVQALLDRAELSEEQQHAWDAFQRAMASRWNAPTVSALLPRFTEDFPLLNRDGTEAIRQLAETPGEAAAEWESCLRALAPRLLEPETAFTHRIVPLQA